MHDLVTKPTSEGKKKIDEERDAIAHKYESEMITASLTHSYYMTPDEIAQLQSCFPRRYIYPSGVYKECSHPVLAALNDFANEDASKTIRSLRNKGAVTMTIGDSAARKLDADHNCLLLNSSREYYRVANLGDVDEDLRNFCVNREPTFKCVRGSEKCGFNAAHAFAIHSTYDIHMRDVADIFTRHGLMTMTVYMYFTTRLYPGGYRDPYPFFNVTDDGEYMLFSMNDESIPYKHAKKTWRDWMTTTIIRTDHFNIVFEVVRSYGPLRVMRLVRVANDREDGCLARNVPLNQIFPNSILVPDMYDAIKKNFRIQQSDLHHFVVPENVAGAIMAYAERTADEGYRYHELATYASGLRRRIVIGSTQFQDPWDVHIEDYHRIIISLFVLGAIARSDRTKTISAAFNELKSKIPSIPIISKMWRKATNRVHDIVRDFQVKHSVEGLVADSKPVDRMGFWFHEFRIVSLPVLAVDEQHDFVVPKPAPLGLKRELPFGGPTAPPKNAVTDVGKGLDPLPHWSCFKNKSVQGHVDITAPAGLFTPRLVGFRVRKIRNPNDFDDFFRRPFETNRVAQQIYYTDQRCTGESQVKIVAAPMYIYHRYCYKVNPVYNVHDYFPHDCRGNLQSIDGFNHDDGVVRYDRQTLITTGEPGRGCVSPKNIKVSTRPAPAPNSRVAYPEHFVAGHCAIQSLYHAANVRTTIATWIEDIHLELLRYVHVNDTNLTVQNVDDYIFRGVFMTSDVSSIALEVAARAFGYHLIVEVFQANKIEYPFGERKVVIYYHNFHFSERPFGGLLAKFDDVINHVIGAKENLHILDVSMAPGYVTRFLRGAGHRVYSARFRPGRQAVYAKPDFEYDNIAQLNAHLKSNRIGPFDLVFNDIGRPVNSEQAINDANSLLMSHIRLGGSLLTKAFGNPHQLWATRCFEDIQLVHSNADCNSQERHFHCSGFNPALNIDRFFDYYDRPGWNFRVTKHNIAYCNNEKFVREFFTGDFKKYAPSTFAMRGYFTVSAITGYASASKTTEAVNRYKNAVFVAPSKQLSLKHQRMGVSSFTPHKFFTERHDNSNTIIVDEAFQFPVDYFSLIATHYPKHEIVVLGDAHQTPYVNFNGNLPHKTLIDYGVINNLCDVYKIPHDIADMLNSKHGFHIRSKSNIKKSIVYVEDDISKFGKLPVICFNGESASRLREKGLNAYTITTFTGSREPVVVFYVDSASVASQLVNRPKYIYTAVSRASDVLVITGDADYIVKYYNIHATKIQTYEEFAAVYLHHDIVLPVDDVLPITVPRYIASDHTSQQHASDILGSVIIPTNDPDGLNVSVGTSDVAPIISGVLTTPTDSLLNVEPASKVYKLQPTRFAKHQLSNNSLEAIQTLAKRYARGYNTTDKREMQFAFTELLNGLSTAIYGNPHSIRRLRKDLQLPEGYLMQRQGAYMEALQIKLNSNPSVIAELDRPIEMGREKLGFFNKRQTKFDASEGFDESDKVGQGVAATSKRINVLFCGYARALLDRIREILRANKRDIILATHDSEAGLNDTFVSMVDRYNVENYTCNDFSEWDSSFRSAFSEVTCLLLKYLGCPFYLINDFRRFRESWIMEYRNAFGTTRLRGHEKQFSGNPFTIAENTLCNMALCFTLFEYKGFQFALFKGDDSAVACGECVPTVKSKRILDYTGHRLKLHNSPIGEFAGWFLTKHGFFPDVYRYAAKFLDKCYRDQEHFEEVVMSLQERCAAVKNQDQLNLGATMCAAFYASIPHTRLPKGSIIKTTRDDAIALYYFLRDSRNVKFSDLQPTNLTSLRL